jgi:hypothetical protein
MTKIAIQARNIAFAINIISFTRGFFFLENIIRNKNIARAMIDGQNFLLTEKKTSNHLLT